jgi:signal transduction histidine kinase/ActR/RegA family two-component response regulator
LGFAENEFPDGSDTFINALHPDDRDRVHAALTAHLSRHEPYNLEFRMRTRAGEWRWFWGRGQAEWAPDGRAVRMAGSNSDITTRKRLEEQLRQSLKMDAVGRLAGGIAHDFNHLLAVIAGNAALALAELPAESVLRSAMQEVARAASRANTLTRQLLAFSHWQAIRPEVVDLDLLLDGIAEPLRRVLGDEAEIVIQPAARKTFVKVDRAQLEEALMHLTANARDAMPSGGAMVLRTEHVEAAGDELGPTPPLSPGSYVRLTVSDTGTGMDETTRLRALEPFFTTKTTGQGAGLGLSTVYGIVRQAGGSVWIDSTMGFGTRIYLYLPAEANSAARAAFAGTSRGRGSETVLLVEDEDAVRSVVLRMLRGQGYAVIEARNGADALEQYERVRGNVDLLVTDLMMPVMGGRDLVVQLRDRVPDLPVIYMSGYAEDARQLVDPRDPLTAVLEKPFTLDSLVRGLGDVLGASGLSNGLNARPAPPA